MFGMEDAQLLKKGFEGGLSFFTSSLIDCTKINEVAITFFAVHIK
jgi:hypothetical protein